MPRCLTLVVACSAIPGAGCDEPLTWSCDTWCGFDVDAVSVVQAEAADATDPQAQCFEELGGFCADGQLRKCTCDVAE